MNSFLKNKKRLLLFIGVLFFLSYITFCKELFFTFTKDDWWLFWGSLYSFDVFRAYWLHPATPIEFLLFARIFGLQAILWQLFGLFIRVALAFIVSLIMERLSNSKLVGALAGIFFASTYTALESISFASAHAGSLSLVFICLSFYYFLKKSFFLFLLFLYIGIFLDPLRALPILSVLPLWYVLARRNKPLYFSKKDLYYSLFVLVPLIFILYWGMTHSGGSLFPFFLSQAQHDYFLPFKKLHLLGNYFTSIGNLFLGWIIPIAQDPQNDSLYNRFIAYIGLGIGAFLLLSLSLLIKRKSQTWRLIFFLNFWLFIFYIPNWLFEPRVPIAGTHRYLVFSAVGFIGLIAVLIARLRSRSVIFLVSSVFIIANIITVNRVLSDESRYRAKDIVNNLWDSVDKDVALGKGKFIFIFSGDQLLLNQAIKFSGGIPFALKRNIGKKDDFPIIVNDTNLIMYYLCEKGYSLNHVYAWEVKPSGRLRNYSIEERKVLQSLTVTKSCI